MPIFNFTGPIPEWVDPEHDGWTFLDASWTLGQDGLNADIEEATRMHNIELKWVKGWQPGLNADAIIPSRPLIMPDVQELWWEIEGSPYKSRTTPYFIRLLLNGTVRAFGDPGRAGAAPEWIAPRVWRGLKPNAANGHLFEGCGCIYWNVRVMDRAGFLAQMEIEADNNQDASPPAQGTPKLPAKSQGGRPRSEKFYVFAREMVRKADLNGLPDSDGSTFSHMQAWCDNQFPEGAPDPSTIRDWLAKLDYRKPEHSQESSS